MTIRLLWRNQKYGTGIMKVRCHFEDSKAAPSSQTRQRSREIPQILQFSS